MQVSLVRQYAGIMAGRQNNALTLRESVCGTRPKNWRVNYGEWQQIPTFPIRSSSPRSEMSWTGQDSSRPRLSIWRFRPNLAGCERSSVGTAGMRGSTHPQHEPALSRYRITCSHNGFEIRHGEASDNDQLPQHQQRSDLWICGLTRQVAILPGAHSAGALCRCIASHQMGSPKSPPYHRRSPVRRIRPRWRLPEE
jgi:hypothetical protein